MLPMFPVLMSVLLSQFPIPLLRLRTPVMLMCSGLGLALVLVHFRRRPDLTACASFCSALSCCVALYDIFF